MLMPNNDHSAGSKSRAHKKCEATHICTYGVQPASHDVSSLFIQVVQVLAVAPPPSPAVAHNAIGFNGVTPNTSKHTITPRQGCTRTYFGSLTATMLATMISLTSPRMLRQGKCAGLPSLK